MTSVKLAWKYNIFKHSINEVLGEWRNRKLMLVWVSHLISWLSIALLEIRFYYWSKYSLCGYMYMNNHKFPVYDAEFLNLKFLKQNTSMDVWELHCKPERTHLTIVVLSIFRSFKFEINLLVPLNLHTELYSHCSPQPRNESQTAHMRLLGSLARYKLLSVGLRDGKRDWRGKEQSDTGY